LICRFLHEEVWARGQGEKKGPICCRTLVVSCKISTSIGGFQPLLRAALPFTLDNTGEAADFRNQESPSRSTGTWSRPSRPTRRQGGLLIL